jgi:cytochrome b561
MATTTDPATARQGYGRVTRLLHWLTVAALLAQFTIGYVMEAEDGGRGRGRGRGRGGDDGDGSGHGRGRGRGRGGDDDEGLLEQGWSLVTAHVALGLAILLLAVIRVVWRRLDGLPPWAETLSARERRLAHVTERVLLAMLFVVPATGLVLVLGDDDWLAAHVTAHVVFFVALAAHLGLVLKHTLVDRDRLLARML